jgi:hypothetical protein
MLCETCRDKFAFSFRFPVALPIERSTIRESVSSLVSDFSQIYFAHGGKMVLLCLPCTFGTPGIHTFNQAGSWRHHGISRHTRSAAVGTSILETRTRQRGRLRISRPDTRARACWVDFVPAP